MRNLDLQCILHMFHLQYDLVNDKLLSSSLVQRMFKVIPHYGARGEWVVRAPFPEIFVLVTDVIIILAFFSYLCPLALQDKMVFAHYGRHQIMTLHEVGFRFFLKKSEKNVSHWK